MYFNLVVQVLQILALICWAFAVYALRKCSESQKESNSEVIKLFRSVIKTNLQLELKVIELEKDIQILKSK